MKITLVTRQEAVSYLPLPLFTSTVPAGFPSPADDYIEGSLDLNQHLIKNPSATFFARASGESMTGAGILDGALLIIDKSITPRNGHIVIAAINGELTCKMLDIDKRLLLASNPAFKAIPIHGDLDFIIEGVVIHAINSLCASSHVCFS